MWYIFKDNNMESIMTNQSKTPIFTEQRYKFYFTYQLFFLQKQYKHTRNPNINGID